MKMEICPIWSGVVLLSLNNAGLVCAGLVKVSSTVAVAVTAVNNIKLLMYCSIFWTKVTTFSVDCAITNSSCRLLGPA